MSYYGGICNITFDHNAMHAVSIMIHMAKCTNNIARQSATSISAPQSQRWSLRPTLTIFNHRLGDEFDSAIQLLNMHGVGRDMTHSVRAQTITQVH